VESGEFRPLRHYNNIPPVKGRGKPYTGASGGRRWN
jgi:hypothetical protein